MNDQGRAIALGRCLRDLLVLGAIGSLSGTAWMAALGAHGHGSGHGSAGHGGLEEGIETHARGNIPYHGIPFPILEEIEYYLYPGEPDMGAGPPAMAFGGPGEGGEFLHPGHHAGLATHLVPDQHAAQADHHHAYGHQAHVGALVHSGQAETPQQTAPHGAASDDADSATAQPDPTANPSFQRPPGAAGPGRRMSGRSGPGLSGPGRRARPQP